MKKPTGDDNMPDCVRSAKAAMRIILKRCDTVDMDDYNTRELGFAPTSLDNSLVEVIEKAAE